MGLQAMRKSNYSKFTGYDVFVQNGVELRKLHTVYGIYTDLNTSKGTLAPQYFSLIVGQKRLKMKLLETCRKTWAV